MHIPDGFLDVKTASATAVLSAVGIGVALRSVGSHPSSQRVPLMGLAGAFVFAAQMLNFPVAAGTSGHLVGGVLISILLGPSAAVLIMSSVLVVQCFLFADGGVLALGANIFNMAIVSSVGGYGIYRVFRQLFPGEVGRLAGAGFASWCATVAASICCAGELSWSGIVSWSAVFPTMTNIHLFIGAGEGLITMLIIAAIGKTRPDLLEETGSKATGRAYNVIVAYGLIITLGLVVFVSPFASRWPDGLERAAALLGFERRAIDHPAVSSPLAEYQIPGVGSISMATVLAGTIGTIVVFLLAIVLARLLVKGPKQQKEI